MQSAVIDCSTIFNSPTHWLIVPLNTNLHFMETIWNYPERTAHSVPAELKVQLKIPSSLVNLLVKRGITSLNEAKEFFRPDLSDLHSPFLMKDMEVAISRISEAKERDEPIMIYGDYDVDGTTSVALVSSFFEDHFKHLHTYIPDRYAEGYGLSFQGIDKAEELGVKLMIALDCGVKANEQISYAQDKGIDMIICDHHLPGPVLPNALAILDPKRPDDEYPYKELSGCGIGFKLIQAFTEKNGGDVLDLVPYLDLVAASIASDIVPVTGENRTLAYFGLAQINSHPRLAFKNLMKGNDQLFTITDLVFKVGPKINAAGRIDHGLRAVDFLRSNDEAEIAQLLEKINHNNEVRKDLDKRITQEALQQIENHQLTKRNSTVVYQPDWHKGVVGIVASRLIEKHYKPTIVLTLSGDVIGGSARSVHGYDVYAALEKCSDSLIQFGGHMYAAGMTLASDKLSEFKEQFEKVVSETLPEHLKKPKIDIDEVLEFSEITPKFYRLLKQFEPFGPRNMNPTFATKDIAISHFRAIGADKTHLKAIANCQKSGVSFDLIGFGLGEKLEILNESNTYDIAYHVELNHFQGHKSIQLSLLDVIVHNG